MLAVTMPDFLQVLANPFGLLITLLILSLLVLIHEAGHFFTAKWFGIKVEEFGFGLPPRAWGKKVGETIYSINWLPIGGFVKLFGEDEAGAGRVDVSKAHGQDHEKLTKEEKKLAFFARPVWQRAVVVTAGVVMNALLAFVIYYVYLSFTGYKIELPLLNDHKFFAVKQTNRLDAILVGDVAPNSPAAKAGMKPCDEGQKQCFRILEINEKKPQSAAEFIATIREYRGQEISLTVEEAFSQKTSKVSLIPRENPPKGEGALGIEFSIQETAVLTYPTQTLKLFSGITYPMNLMSYNYDLMKMLVQRSIEQRSIKPASQGVSGPLGVFSIGNAISSIPDPREQFLQYLNLAGLLSMSLAFFNILPIPALDGGRLFFILIEGIFRRKVNQRFETIAHTIGMAVLITLILLVTFKDILQFFG